MSASFRSATIAVLLLAGGTAAEAAPKRAKHSTKPRPTPAAAPAAVEEKSPADEPAPTTEAEPEPARPTRPAASTRSARASAARESAAAATVVKDTTPAAVSSSSRTRPERKFAFLLSVGMHADDGAVRGHTRVGGSQAELTDEFGNESRIFGAFGVLGHITERIRIGGQLRYYGKWDYKVSNQNNQPVQEMGTLVELVGLTEGRIPMTNVLDLMVGGDLGFGVLFPGGTFEKEIRTAQAQGLPVWGTPRLGYVAGLQVGTRYRVLDRVYARADFGADWAQTFLLYSSKNLAGQTIDLEKRLNVVRYHFGLSMEVSL